MYSWYVERLLLERENIREGLFSPNNGVFWDNFEQEPYVESYIDSELYEDLLTVEIRIGEMLDKDLLTDKEIVILRMILSNKPLSRLEKEINISRDTIIKTFKDACGKIGEYIGDYFPDDRYIGYISEKHGLDITQQNLLKKYITSNIRHKGLKNNDKKF